MIAGKPPANMTATGAVPLNRGPSFGSFGQRSASASEKYRCSALYRPTSALRRSIWSCEIRPVQPGFFMRPQVRSVTSISAAAFLVGERPKAGQPPERGQTGLCHFLALTGLGGRHTSAGLQRQRKRFMHARHTADIMTPYDEIKRYRLAMASASASTARARSATGTSTMMPSTVIAPSPAASAAS